MSFITQNDYSTLIRKEIKEILLEEGEHKLTTAEDMAIAQVKNHLAGKYDIEAIFSAVGKQRNSHIIMICIDCTLYHLYSSISRREVPDTRATRYQDAIDWLKAEKASVSISADLPSIKNEQGQKLTGFKISSKYKASNHRW